MESVIRKVRDIEEEEKPVLEHVLGRQLHDNQQIVMKVETLGGNTGRLAEVGDKTDSDALPAWCIVFVGLTEVQRSDIAILLERANLTRPSLVPIKFGACK
jgi:hypothetical protein